MGFDTPKLNGNLLLIKEITKRLFEFGYWTKKYLNEYIQRTYNICGV